MVPRAFQLSVFGLVLHILGVEWDVLEPCLLPDWEVAYPASKPDLTIQVHYEPFGKRTWIEVGAARATETMDSEELGASLDQVIHLQIAEHSPAAVFIHAGVVKWKDSAILIPGTSMAGKSTLTRALVNTGCTYYSDEFAPLLPDGRILPYPKALNQRQISQPAQRIPARDLGWSPALSPIPVGVIAAVRYSADPGLSGVGKLSEAQAAIALLENTVGARRAPERSLRAAAFAARRALCIGGQRGDAGDFAHFLLSLNSSLPANPS